MSELPAFTKNSLDSLLTFLAAQANRLVSNQNRRHKWHKCQSQKELSVFTQAEYSYLLGFRMQGTQKHLKLGVRKIERTTDQYLLWRVGGNRRTPFVEYRQEKGVCQRPLTVNSNCLLRGPTIPCWIPNRWRTTAVTLQRCQCFQNATPVWPGWARSLLHANILPRLWFPHGSRRKDQEVHSSQALWYGQRLLQSLCAQNKEIF